SRDKVGFVGDNEGMLTMNEPQVWTLIGVFAGSLGIIVTLVVAMMKNMATGLRTEMRLGFEAVGVRFDAVDRRFDGIDKRLDGVDKRLDGLDSRVGRLEARFDHLERDVTTLFRRDFGESI
ncbi:hypothetical protein WDU99_06780, partial [Microbacterium sp. Mu-80]